MVAQNGRLRSVPAGGQLHDNGKPETKKDGGQKAPDEGRNDEGMIRDHVRAPTSYQQPRTQGPRLSSVVTGVSKVNNGTSGERFALVHSHSGERYGTLDEDFDDSGGEGGDREPLLKQTTPKTSNSSAARHNIVRSSYLQYLYISIIMGLAGAVAFGVFLDGADLFLGPVELDLQYIPRVILLTVSLSFGHAFGFHAAEHVQACCKIPFRTVGEIPFELPVVTLSGCLTWAVVLGITQALYEPGVGLEELLYTTAGDILGGMSWAIGLDLYLQSRSVELTACKIFGGWTRNHFIIDFLTKLPSTFVLIWLMDLFLLQLNMSKSLDRFFYNFTFVSCLFVNFLLVAGVLRDFVFERRNMVPVRPASTSAIEISGA